MMNSVYFITNDIEKCNELIESINQGLDENSLSELGARQKDALKLQEISVIISKRLQI